MMQENCIKGGDYEEKAGNAVGSDHAGNVGLPAVEQAVKKIREN